MKPMDTLTPEYIARNATMAEILIGITNNQRQRDRLLELRKDSDLYTCHEAMKTAIDWHNRNIDIWTKARDMQILNEEIKNDETNTEGKKANPG